MALAAVLLAVPTFANDNPDKPSGAANPSLTPSIDFQLCRTDVAPCQREIRLPAGEDIALDLFLTIPSGPKPPEPLRIVGWEAHLELKGDAVAEVVPAAGANSPIQMQGAAELVLHPFQRLHSRSRSNLANSAPIQYFLLQNQYDPDTGQLDYSVILLGTDSLKLGKASPPFSDATRALLGRLNLKSEGSGKAQLTVSADSVRPIQLAVRNKSDETRSWTLANQPSTSLEIGPAAERSRLVGRAWAQARADRYIPLPYRRQLTLTFWRQGAVPPWQGGSDEPLLTFFRLTTGYNGSFVAKDIPQSLLPAGNYDLRVTGIGSLPSLVPDTPVGVVGAGPSSLPLVVQADFGVLRDGDINGDGVVNGVDLAALQASFGKTPADESFNPVADFNLDRVVDSQDFSLLAANYNRLGE